MKKILKLIMIFTFAFIITGCNCKSTVEISYKDLEKKLENKESGLKHFLIVKTLQTIIEWLFFCQILHFAIA